MESLVSLLSAMEVVELLRFWSNHFSKVISGKITHITLRIKLTFNTNLYWSSCGE